MYAVIHTLVATCSTLILEVKGICHVTNSLRVHQTELFIFSSSSLEIYQGMNISRLGRLRILHTGTHTSCLEFMDEGSQRY